MERQEPTFGSESADVEIPPDRGHRPAYRPPARQGDHLAWKIGLAVGVGVLAALLLFNAYERRQARHDAEEALRVVSAEMRRLERELGVPAVDTRPVRHAPPARIVYPVPPGYRCSGGALLHRAGNSWTQVTARSNHVYCPHGGTVADCYPVTPQNVGCR